MSEELVRRHEGHVTHLTLNRPQKANALSAPLVESMLNAVEYAYSDGTRLLVLEGAGAHFCAGFDFSGYLEADEGELALRFIRIETLLQSLHHAPFETLALAHGRNFGAGADLVCACSVRIAAPGATFQMPGLKFGVVLGTRRLANRIGADAAREILSASRAFDAEEALRIRFLTRLAPQAEWPAIAAEARARCTQLSPIAVAGLRRQTVLDTRDEDMAALARSVSVPGLKERIRLFRETSR
ncbi:MAG: enoyl-CoA hydratase/isomerase family protein [Betaproteobacteria bacterium]|nr:enoyl-CoA hydratase/isomerase family protein [Betaproteobacteria bacterium]